MLAELTNPVHVFSRYLSLVKTSYSCTETIFVIVSSLIGRKEIVSFLLNCLVQRLLAEPSFRLEYSSLRFVFLACFYS
jgi:hypothetical protein